MSFFRVLSAELSKLYRQKRLYIFLLIPILFIMFMCFIVSKSNGTLLGPEMSVQLLYNVMPLLGFFFVIMTASYLIAEDYESGTLKLSIMRPISRFTVFNAKVATLCIAIFTFYSLFFLATLFIPDILYGRQETIVFTENYQISEFTGLTMSWQDTVIFIAKCYLLGSTGAFVLGTIMLFFSTSVPKASVAITLSVILFVICYVWMAVFSNTDMIAYSPWTFMYIYVPYFSSILGRGEVWGGPAKILSLMGIYTLVFYVLSCTVFLRRNIIR